MPSDWITFPCADPQQRWRYLDNGLIEVDGIGTPTRPFPPAVTQWKPLIDANAAKYRVPAHYIAGPMSFESSGNPRATSCDSKGPPVAPCKVGKPIAYGLMQFTWSTAKTIAKTFGRTLTDPSELYDPALSIELGAAYMADLLKRYKGDYVSAAVGYNAGKVICGGCRSGTFWGVCTDGSQYPLLAIKAANAALINGFPLGFPDGLPLPPVNQPPIQVTVTNPLPPWAALLVTAVGSYAAYQWTLRHLQGRRPAFV